MKFGRLILMVDKFYISYLSFSIDGNSSFLYGLHWFTFSSLLSAAIAELLDNAVDEVCERVSI